MDCKIRYDSNTTQRILLIVAPGLGLHGDAHVMADSGVCMLDRHACMHMRYVTPSNLSWYAAKCR